MERYIKSGGESYKPNYVKVQFIHDLTHERGYRHMDDILIRVDIDEDGIILTSDEEI